MKKKLCSFLAGTMLYAASAYAHPLKVVIDKSDREIVVETIEDVVLKSPVIIGGVNKDYHTGKYRMFPTPTGKFYVSAVFEHPVWIPPKWAKAKKPSSRVYGPWMMILQKKPKPVELDWIAYAPYDSGVRVHSTDKVYLFEKKYFKNARSHGCVRLPPEKIIKFAKELLSYGYDGPYKTRRGDMYVLKEPLEIIIVK